MLILFSSREIYAVAVYLTKVGRLTFSPIKMRQSITLTLVAEGHLVVETFPPPTDCISLSLSLSPNPNLLETASHTAHNEASCRHIWKSVADTISLSIVAMAHIVFDTCVKHSQRVGWPQTIDVNITKELFNHHPTTSWSWAIETVLRHIRKKMLNSEMIIGRSPDKTLLSDDHILRHIR